MSLAAATPLGRWSRYGQLVVWLSIGALVMFLLAVFSAGLFLYAVLVVGLSLVASLVFASLAAGGLRLQRSLSETSVPPGRSVDVTLKIENRKPLPVPWFFCRDQVEEGLKVDGGTALLQTLAGDGEATIVYKVSAKRRGLYRIGPSVAEASDPLGFVRRFVTDRQPEFLTVFPEVVPVGESWPLGHSAMHRTPRRRSLFEDPARFVGIRSYQPSDSIRRIHWRATARLGSLQVKTFEPASLQGALLLVDGAPPADEEAFELAMTTAASISEFVLFEGQKVGLISNGGDAADRYPQWSGGTFRRIEEVIAHSDERSAISGFAPLEVKPGRGSWQAERVRAALGRLVPAEGVTLAELIEIEMPRFPRDLVAIVITTRIDEALALALDGLRHSGIEVTVAWMRAAELAEIDFVPALPAGVPLHAISDAVQLENIGAHAL